MKKFAKYLSLLTIIISLFTVFAVQSSAATKTNRYQDPTGDIYEYVVLDETNARITGFESERTEIDLVIPETIKGYTVTEIGPRVFRENLNIKSVVFPDAVTEISNAAFGDCENIESIDLPESLVEIGWSAFSSNYALKEIYIPDNVKTIEPWAFGDCINVEKITFGNVSDCTIGFSAFTSTNIKTLYIPEGVLVGPCAFDYSLELESVVIDGKPYLEETKYSGGKVEITYPTEVFYGCEKLKEVTFSENYGVVYEGMFADCTSLDKVNFEALSEIRGYAFENTAFTEIDIPDTVKLVDDVFANCKKLEKATVGNGSSHLFDGCTNLKEAIVRKYTAEYMFNDCVNLEKVTILSNWVIADYMFKNCEKLTTIDSRVERTGTSSNEISAGAFFNCKSITTDEVLALFDKSKWLEIERYAFYGCSSLTSFDKFTEFTIHEIGSYAFANCTGFDKIVLPDNLDWFKDHDLTTENVFMGCTNVKYLYLGPKFQSRPESIGLQTLDGLERIDVAPENKLYFSHDGVLYYNYSDYGGSNFIGLLKYPAYKTDASYSTASVVPADKEIRIYEYAFSKTQYLKELELTGKPVADFTVQGDDIYSQFQSQYAFEYSSIEKFTCRDGYFNVIAINMFHGSQIEEIDLKKTVYIKKGAFSDCKNLKHISFLNGYNLSASAFANCTELTTAVFGTTKGYLADTNTIFYNCDKLTFYCGEDSEAYNYAQIYDIPCNTININVVDGGVFAYTGKEICPSVIVGIGAMNLVQERDYILVYSDNIEVGKGLVKVVFIGNFEGIPEMGTSFTITKRDASTLTVEYVVDNEYSGEEIKPKVVVKYGDKTLVEGTDYTITYNNGTNAGSMFFTIKGIGNYTGSVDCYYNIIRRDITEATVSKNNDMIYTGKELTPKPVITWNGFTLVEDVDYEIRYFENVNAGYGTMVIYGMGNFCGTQRVQFRIFGKGLENATVSEISDQTYTGNEITPNVSVVFDGVTLVKDTDYTVKYENNIEKGVATVVISGIGNYSGVVKQTFNINKNSVYSFTVFSETEMTETYDGTELKPEMEVYFGTQLLTEGVDYTVSLENNVNAGTATVTIIGMGIYEGERSYNFTILPCEITEQDISVSGNMEYNGVAVEPEISVVKNGATLVEGEDYIVTYSNNNGVGVAFVTVEGIGNYCDTVNLQYEIYSSQPDDEDENENQPPENVPSPTPDEDANNTDNKDNANNTQNNTNQNVTDNKENTEENNNPVIPNTDSNENYNIYIVCVMLSMTCMLALMVIDTKKKRCNS
ncbi:MAG: hypothetical protein E7528_06740 [Ruminococcaceae bacterium]|nr:hypothetical protein [Oscillospiraceae bacterium]